METGAAAGSSVGRVPSGSCTLPMMSSTISARCFMLHDWSFELMKITSTCSYPSDIRKLLGVRFRQDDHNAVVDVLRANERWAPSAHKLSALDDSNVTKVMVRCEIQRA